ncbi:amidase domain-containing protein [Virgibacillus salexigens]|uniref:amidase domain-containing protein n=1 Tax=Virgibacillus salexigens TaxID=61016 RepID=UPI00190A8075|nr:amidase domain-containing protein [Virgibacillus salexigens]
MEKLKDYWIHMFESDQWNNDWWKRKKALLEERNASIVHIKGNGHLYRKIRYDQATHYNYHLHLSLLVKQQEQLYLEESVYPYTFQINQGEISDHRLIINKQPEIQQNISPDDIIGSDTSTRFSYDRHAAVQYAERWWNSYNPAYKKFEVDCTNYVSQCMFAGGAPMRGAPVRERGWWYGNGSWSFSWAVAHSLRWYLSGSTQGLRGEEVESAGDLLPGDIICYDFEGDGRWNHNTIVVAKDAYGMPLVNAHTDNSRNRYWSYEDSTAWTPEIKYKFFRIY